MRSFNYFRYSAFADLFCDAIKSGLPALQTQHPGLYFHKSAEYLSKRKEAYQQCCAQSSGQMLDGNQMSNIFWSDFFGVRGTKLSEPMNEQQMIIMVQETEKSFNHSVSWELYFLSFIQRATPLVLVEESPGFFHRLLIYLIDDKFRLR